MMIIETTVLSATFDAGIAQDAQFDFDVPVPKAVSPGFGSTRCVINGIVKVQGHTQLFFVYYDLQLNPRGPPPRSDPTAWKIAPCRDVVSKTTVYRFR